MRFKMGLQAFWGALFLADVVLFGVECYLKHPFGALWYAGMGTMVGYFIVSNVRSCEKQ